MGKIDSAAAVICQDVDLTLSSKVGSMAEFAQIARAAGVDVQGPGPWRFNCNRTPSAPSGMVAGVAPVTAPAGQVVAGQLGGSDASNMAFDGSAAAPAPPPAPTGIYAYAEGSTSKVDRLVQRGFRPIGCVDDRFGFRSPEGYFMTVTMADMRRSEVGAVIRCKARTG